MRKNTAFRIAASTLVVSLATVGCTPEGQQRVASLSSKAPKAEKQADKLYALAMKAAAESKMDEALGHIEKAVELSPRDVAYRMVLGDLYLKNGRFLSAEQAFGDVLALNPGNGRAYMSAALAQIAQGKTAEALQVLDRMAGTAQPSDLGLAYALAGQPQRAISILDPVARGSESDGRVRQNLALAHALAGDWQKARVIASQDVSPAELGERLQQWAAMAQPQAPYTQVAALLGVTNVPADSGQPVALALAPASPEPVALAEASPAEVPAEPAPAPVEPVAAPAAVAKVELPASEPTAIERLEQAVKLEQPAPVVGEAQVVRAVDNLVQPKAPLIRTTLPAFKSAKADTGLEPVKAKKAVGRYVVQIGAFKTAQQAETAWANAQKRYSLADREPLGTTIDIAGKGTFHRLSVSGFDSHGEAGRFCAAIKAKGGACFVRTTAGDSPVQWASRKAGKTQLSSK